MKTLAAWFRILADLLDPLPVREDADVRFVQDCLKALARARGGR
jgi:hypothetical protein